MQAVETVLVGDVAVSALLYQHLADLYVAIEGGVVNCEESLVERLHIHPLLDYVSILVLIISLDSLFNLFEKAPENDGLVLDGGLVE